MSHAPRSTLQAPSERWMKLALRLAARGRGRVSPNPLVGCVVVRRGQVVGRGFHLYDPKDHAEAIALREAGEQARGADLYVNLEPCSHQGRTPPCSRRIIEAGVSRVVVATPDPNPLVAGRGIESLRRAGVEVVEGLCRQRAEKLNEVFFYFIQTGRPFTLLKLALTLDGKIATPRGHSQWITGEKSRRLTHRLRFEYDAILVGAGTILQDDPSLTARWRRRNRITRVVLDSRLRTPAAARLFESPDPVILFHGPKAAHRRRLQLGVKSELQEVSECKPGLNWDEILQQLGRRNITSLMVEGGSRVAASALSAGIVNKLCWFYGPRIVGGRDLPAVGDLGVKRLEEALKFDRLKVRSLGGDFVVEAYPALPMESR